MSILITTVIYNNYSISYKKISLKLHSKFKISRGSKSTVNTLLISAKKDGYKGIGECVEYKRYNENLKDITKYLNNTRKQNDILKVIPENISEKSSGSASSNFTEFALSAASSLASSSMLYNCNFLYFSCKASKSFWVMPCFFNK